MECLVPYICSKPIHSPTIHHRDDANYHLHIWMNSQSRFRSEIMIFHIVIPYICLQESSGSLFDPRKNDSILLFLPFRSSFHAQSTRALMLKRRRPKIHATRRWILKSARARMGRGGIIQVELCLRTPHHPHFCKPFYPPADAGLKIVQRRKPMIRVAWLRQRE